MRFFILHFFGLMFCGCAAIVDKPELYNPVPENDWHYFGPSFRKDKIDIEVFPENYDCTLYSWGPILPILPGFILSRGAKVSESNISHDEKLKIRFHSYDMNTEPPWQNGTLEKITLVLDGKKYEPEKIENLEYNASYVTFPVSAQRRDFDISVTVIFPHRKVTSENFHYHYTNKTRFLWTFPKGNTFCGLSSMF
jgi:hypothetical protein